MWGVRWGGPFAGNVGACVGARDLFVAFETAGSAAGLRDEGDGKLDEFGGEGAGEGGDQPGQGLGYGSVHGGGVCVESRSRSWWDVD